MGLVTSYQTAEYGKFIQLGEGSEFPPLSVTRYSYPDKSEAFPENNNASPLSSVDVYPKYAVLTHIVNPLGVDIKFQDGSNLDAFGRLRASMPTTLFDSKTLHDKQSLFWSQVTGANAFVGFTGDNIDASVTLSASNNGAYAIRQTKQRFNYQPGKSQLFMGSGVLTPSSNSIKRIGLFTSLTDAPYNPNCGLYFETQTDSPSSIAVVQQNGSFLVPSVSARREDWNIDKLDGTGSSKKILDLNYANIFLIDFEWLGVGRVRFGFVIDGNIIYCHEINNTGRVPGAYIKTPNLPVRGELRQINSGTSSMKMICSSVISEGGSDYTGVTRSVNTGNTPITITTTYNRRALLGLRLQAAKLDSVNQLLNIQIANLPQGNSTEAFYKYEVILNPTIGGTVVTWNNVADDSNLQYAVAPDNTITVSGGTVISSGFANLNGSVELGGERYMKFLKLGCSVDGIRDEFWVVFTPLDGKSSGQFASINFVESD